MPDFAVCVIPETDAEKVLLMSVWAFGKLEVSEGVNGTKHRFLVTARAKEVRND